MTVRPEDCTKLSKEREELLRSLERKIDKKLQEKYVAGEKVSLWIPKPPDKVLDAIYKKYEEAGWTVTSTPLRSYRNEPPEVNLTFSARNE